MITCCTIGCEAPAVFLFYEAGTYHPDTFSNACAAHLGEMLDPEKHYNVGPLE